MNEQAKDAWQPIETAPRDGTHVLTVGERGYAVAFLRPEISSRTPAQWLTAQGKWQCSPTHWRPLPDPPTQGQQP